jgi:lysophospholipase L1-like esterase
MAKSGHETCVRCAVSIAVFLVALGLIGDCRAQGQVAPIPAPLPKSCEASVPFVDGSSPLPHLVAALKERKKIKILAIGATSASLRGPVSGGLYAVLERFLESTFKGLDVEVVHRGVSGELASDAGERIKTEVALENPDLVLWQLGTADALAQIPVEDFEDSIVRTIEWLKEHQVDVILVGVRYAANMAKDEHYQAIRAVTQKIARQQNVLRIARYEAEETMEKLRRQQGEPLSEVEATEAGYSCLAEYLARAIAAGLFVKGPRDNGAP